MSRRPTSALIQRLQSSLGRQLGRLTGGSEATELHRGPAPALPVQLATLDGPGVVTEGLGLLGIESGVALADDGPAGAAVPAYPAPIGALLVDACGLSDPLQTEQIRAVLRPALRHLADSGRIVLFAAARPATLPARVAVAALEGMVRTVAKELRHGATANLVRLHPGVKAAELRSTLSFVLSGRSAFVSGQCWEIGPAGDAVAAEAGLAERVVAVTGAARGIGAEIVRVLAAAGAQVVCVDVPAAGEQLAALTNQHRGLSLQLDIATPNAGAILAELISRRFGARGQLHGIVHNAGITRDRLLVNTDSRRWAEVLQVNLLSQLRMNQLLLDGRPGGLAAGGRIVTISSTSGIAGNRGQANYATAKAGLIGMVQGLSVELTERGITANAVAPGFIKTAMTDRIPWLPREIFQRSSSLGQAGLPVDVAEAVNYFLDPTSAGVNGQVLRVCGQLLVGR